jgi:uncharacterized protein (TIGR02271 family)
MENLLMAGRSHLLWKASSYRRAPLFRENTIIAAFRSSTDAQAAASELQAAGISREDIYLDINTSDDKSSHSRTRTAEHGISGWFKSIFGENDDPDRSGYEEAVTQGNCLLRVDVGEDEIATVEDILSRHSPIDVHAATDKPTEAQRSTSEGVGRQAAERGQAKEIPVVQEQMQVGKRQVLRGGVRVYSRVVEEPAEESISLREERVRVERQPVNRSATEADLSAGQQRVIEVQEFAEEPVISKQARVVEEVRVGKDVSERTQTVRDNVRHTEVNVEQNPRGTGETQNFDDSEFRSDFQNRYGTSGAPYDTYQPAYRYGYDMASDPRYQGRSFDEVESDLRSDYGRRYPNSSWEKMKDAISYGWNRVTGKARATAR